MAIRFKTNAALVKIFYEMSSLLAMAGVEWKPAAYQKAASSIEGLDRDVKAIYKAGGTKALEKIDGVGEAIAKKIEQFLKTGKIKRYEAIKGAKKSDLGEITNVTSMGPKKAMRLYQELGVKNLRDLEKAAKEHKICKLAGFKEKSEQDILAGIKLYRARGPRKSYSDASKIAKNLVSALRKTRLAKRVEIAGSLRRKKATIGDIDLLATSRKPKGLMEKFTSLPQVKRVLAHGPTKSMVVLKNNMQADLRVVDEASYGAALLYFTGDRQFNIEMRKKAIRLGFKLSEYGLFDRKSGKKLASKTEAEIFKKLGYKKVISPMDRVRN